MPLNKRPARIETECELLVSLVWLGRLIGGGRRAAGGGRKTGERAIEGDRKGTILIILKWHTLQ